MALFIRSRLLPKKPPTKDSCQHSPLAPSSILIHVLSPFVHPTCPLKVWIYLGVKWHEAIWVQQQLPAYPGGVGSGTPGIAAVRNASGLLLSAAQPCLHPGLGLKMPPLFLPLFMVYCLLFIVYCLLLCAAQTLPAPSRSGVKNTTTPFLF